MEKIKRVERIQLYISFLKKEMMLSIRTFLIFAVKNNIPEITARRDLKILQNLNYIIIDFGLIKYNADKEYETTRNEKISKNKEKKFQIALKAIEEINEKEIFVGPGTTCEIFVKSINKPINLLFTNGFEVAKIANSNEYIKRVVVIGGRLRPQSSALCGPIAETAIESLRFSQTFITITDIDEDLNLYNNNEDEAYLTNKIIKNSNKVICLADSTKFIKSVFGHKVCELRNISKIITSKDLDKEWTDKINKICDIKW